jgi:hypothetical protein
LAQWRLTTSLYKKSTLGETLALFGIQTRPKIELALCSKQLFSAMKLASTSVTILQVI